MKTVTAIILAAAMALAAMPAGAQEDISKLIIAKEQAALDRWGSGDPEGYLELMADEFTYFDPSIDMRIDGLKNITAYLMPLKGKIYIERFKMANPLVQLHGNVALLTFNLLEYETQPDGSEKVNSRWNSTEVFAQIDGEWKLIHSHWSYTKPELK